MCGLPPDEWHQRAQRVEQRIAALAEHVNQRRLERFLAMAQQDEPRQAGSWLDEAGAALAEMLAPERTARAVPVVLAEQEEFHPLLEDVPPEVAAKLPHIRVIIPAQKSSSCPSAIIPRRRERRHVVGQLGLADETENLDAASGLRDPRLLVGRSGIERLADAALRGQAGLDVQRIDHRGRAMGIEHRRLPEPGRDVTLSIDPVLQRAAEVLLDDACQHSAGAGPPEGAAAVVMDIATGELWVSACALRFDPRIFAAGDRVRLAALFAAENHPLVDRVAKMAIPPGSVFKTVTAVALLEERVCDPDEPFFCQGYLDTPDSQRCLVFRQQGVGHGDVTLPDALARSCNVYFFHHARSLGVDRLIAWSERLGFGRPTGVGLPEEAAGELPHPEPGASDGQRLGGCAIAGDRPGQAAGDTAASRALHGRLGQRRPPRSPHARKRGRESFSPPVVQIPLKAETLWAVREGMTRAVADPDGTAYSSCPVVDRGDRRQDRNGADRWGRSRLVCRFCTGRGLRGGFRRRAGARRAGRRGGPDRPGLGCPNAGRSGRFSEPADSPDLARE